MSVVENARNQLVSSGSWSVDPVHSTVEFHVKHMMIQTVRGRFRDFDAAIVAGNEPSHFNGDDSRLALAGDLTIKGITRPITLDGELHGTVVDADGSDRMALVLGGFGCPCHGSQFDNEGNRVAGPAPRAPPVARPPVQRQSRRRCRVRAHPRLRAQFAGEPVTGPEAWLYPVVRPS